MVVRKMKEKCKDAARMRREKERIEFIELSKLLPLPSSTTNQLDKASIIRLTSSYLRMRNAFPEGLGENWGNQLSRKTNNSGANNNSNCSISNNFICKTNNTQHTVINNTTSTTNHHHLQHYQQQHHHQQIRELGSLILQTLDGFVFALHKDGKIMYVSETASVHLGLPQIDLTGSSIFEYIHSSDRNDIYQVLNIDDTEKLLLESKLTKLMLEQSLYGNNGTKNIFEETFELPRSFCIRMKCILPKRNAGLVISGYKPIHCNGYLKVRCRLLLKNTHNSFDNSSNSCVQLHQQNQKYLAHDTSPSSSSSIGIENQKDLTKEVPIEIGKGNNVTNVIKAKCQYIWEGYTLVAVGHSLLPTASTEVKLTSNSFMFRASLDLKLNFIEPSVTKLLDFQPTEMISQSLYQFIHIDDIPTIEMAHKSLLEKGQVVSRYYRLMKKEGGSIWIQSFATMVNNLRNINKPQHIVGTCFVLGDNNLDNSCIYNDTKKHHPLQQENEFFSSGEFSYINGLDVEQAAQDVAINDRNSKKKTKKNKNDKRNTIFNSSKTKQHHKGTINNMPKPKNNQPNKQEYYLTVNNSDLQYVTNTQEEYYQNKEDFVKNNISSNNNSTNNSQDNVNFSPYNNNSSSDNHSQYQCQCYVPQVVEVQNGATISLKAATPTTGTDYNFHLNHQPIGPIRRASDDSCSIVSSVASSSAKSLSNGSQVSSLSNTSNLIIEQQSPIGNYITYLNYNNTQIDDNDHSLKNQQHNLNRCIVGQSNETNVQGQQNLVVQSTTMDNNNNSNNISSETSTRSQIYQATSGGDFWSLSHSLADHTNNNYNNQYSLVTTHHQQYSSTQQPTNINDNNQYQCGGVNFGSNNSTRPYGDFVISYHNHDHNHNQIESTNNHFYQTHNNLHHHHYQQQLAIVNSDYTISI